MLPSAAVCLTDVYLTLFEKQLSSMTQSSCAGFTDITVSRQILLLGSVILNLLTIKNI